jgi:hypothetical protein
MVPDQVYTDRREFIDYYYKSAINAIERRSMSSVLLGHRRMGKTEIFKRVVNRLFFEQDHKDPDALVPVFFEFPDAVVSRKDFAVDYIENFIRWFVAFRLNDARLIKKNQHVGELIKMVEGQMTISEGFALAIDLLKAVLDDGAVIPEKKAVNLPRHVAFLDDATIVMFLDEFQNTSLPHLNFSITGFFQQAVESPRCPHFVTGSAMSILSDEMMGRGALYGRFEYEHIEPLTDYWGAELALRSARYYRADLPELMAPVVSDRCGGNPFYITAVIRQASKQGKSISDEETLSETLAVDLSSGFIWGELSDQVNRWIERVNEHGATKWILYLAALEDEDAPEISLERIQEELKNREGKEVSLQNIKKTLVRLARGDLVEYKSFGNWFGKVNDPILNEFLRVWGETEVARQNAAWVQKKTIRTLSAVERRFHDYKGYLAEVFMIQILWNSQGKKLPGRLFHSDGDIAVPDRFIFIDQRHRPGAGPKMETDIYADAGTRVWLGESKWWNRPVGPDPVAILIRQGDIVKEREGKYLKSLRLWLFAYDGVTESAEALMREHGVLWSDKNDMNQLLEGAGLRRLPEFDQGMDINP